MNLEQVVEGQAFKGIRAKLPKEFEPSVQKDLDQSFKSNLVQAFPGHRAKLSNGFGLRLRNKCEPSFQWDSDQAFKGIWTKCCKGTSIKRSII